MERADVLDAEDAIARLRAAGFYGVEIAAYPDFVSVYAWRKYQRPIGMKATGGSLMTALTDAVEKAEAIPIGRDSTP